MIYHGENKLEVNTKSTLIPLFWPQIYKEEWLMELSKIMDTRWIGQGPIVDEFEHQFAKKFKYDYCIATNSGTAALELAYHLIGINEGDEVLTTVFTCTATNIPLLRRKANIIFVDIDDNLLISYEDLKRKISNKTKAIVVVTLGGLPVDEKIFILAKEYNIPIVIDACQSLGTSEKYGDYICYSFQAIKHFTTGDGGMLVVKNENDYNRAKKLRWFGIDREAKKRTDWQCVVNHQMAMQIEEAGYKFHMNDIAAALGIVGLNHSDEILSNRKLLCETYNNLLNDKVKCIYGGAYWLFAVVLDHDRSEIIEKLRSSGIECDPVQLRNDIFNAFGGYRRDDLSNMNNLENRYFYLPLNHKVSIDNVNYIAITLNSCLK